MSAARKSAYVSTIHCTSLAVAPRSRWMTGRATLTTEPSIKAMLDPRMVATSTQTPTGGAQGVASGAERITPSSQGDFTKVAMVVRFLVLETVDAFPGCSKTDAQVFSAFHCIISLANARGVDGTSPPHHLN